MPRPRFEADLEARRQQWRDWARPYSLSAAAADLAADDALRYLELGLPAPAVVAVIRTRRGWRMEADATALLAETDYCERARADAVDLGRRGVIAPSATAHLVREYDTRLAAIGEVENPLAAAAPEPLPAIGPAPVPPPLRPAAPAAVPAAPSGPPFSLRDLFAEHSVLILAALGAFLLVVATVLFELYGTGGLGGGVRLAAVVALNLVFALGGYFALRVQRLRAVGQIYIALAAVLLPLVGVAAWTFLDLGRRGITVDQAVAITGAACAVAYGTLALRLGLRAYAEMTGLAILVAAVFLAHGVLGRPWMAAGIAAAPLVYAVWLRALRSPVFSHFPWFAHAAAAVAVLAALDLPPTGWLWTVTFAVLATAYLAWQAIAPQPARAAIGWTAYLLAAASAAGPLGLGRGHFLLPIAAAAPLVLLCRAWPRRGGFGARYRTHPAHLHLAVALTLGLAVADFVFGGAWSLAMGLGAAFALYLLDYGLEPTAATGYALRATLAPALAAAGRAAGLGPWTGALVAGAGLAYAVPLLRPARLAMLARHPSAYFYGTLALAAAMLFDATIAPGRWEIVAALLVATAAFGAAAQVGAVPVSGIVARVLFSAAWFAGVEALGARGWRGPLDALLALLYVALAQARPAARVAVFATGRREFIHASALVAVALCLLGPEDLLWWRLAAAFGLLAAGYWWLALTRSQPELPWAAWTATAIGAAALAVALVAQPWRGAAMGAAALALTGAWAAGRGLRPRPPIDVAGLPVVAALAGLGAVLGFGFDPPRWSQAAALLLAGATLLAWSRLRPDPHALRASLRAGAAVLATAGTLLAVAVPHLGIALAGVVVVAAAAAHAEWSARASHAIERWYAAAALLALGPVLFAWPYPDALAGVVAAEFAGLATLAAATAVRLRTPALAYAAALLPAAAVHFGVMAAGLGRSAYAEEVALAGLAWWLGASGLALHTRFHPDWARATEAAAATVALGALAALFDGHPDAVGLALLAYAPVAYVAGLQERERWVLPGAVGLALGGAFTLLAFHQADTLLYPAAVGVAGLLVWGGGRLQLPILGRAPWVEMHRYLGLGLIAAAGLAAFAFPDRTGARSLGALLAAAAFLAAGGVLWLDAHAFAFRPHRYLAVIAAGTAGFFLAREVGLESWELVPAGLAVIGCGVALRHETQWVVAQQLRQGMVAFGLTLVLGWAAAESVAGLPWWLIALLVEGALTVAAGIVLRSRVLVGGGGAALALVSLRALLTVAESGYLFAAFGAVAVVLLVAATGLALGRDRYLAGARDLREQLAQWD